MSDGRDKDEDANRDPYVKADGKLLLTAEIPMPGVVQGVAPTVGLCAVLVDDIKLLWDRGMGIQIAQLYELVIPGLILTRHVFEGLRRRLYCDDSQDADRSKLVYTRTPGFDVTLDRSRFPCNPSTVKVKPPKDKTFVVIISPNKRHQEKYPMVDGWIDRWNWVPADEGLAEAPVEWVDRYDRKIFTRS